jgi:hypothetical protein
MSQAAKPSRESTLRHRRVPVRALPDALMVARPSDGAAVMLESTAASVWHLLDDWTTPDAVDRRLGDMFPGVAPADRSAARVQILQTLWDEGLLERA